MDTSIICSGRLGEQVIEDNLCGEFIKHLLMSSSEPFRLSKKEIEEACLVSPSYEMLSNAGLEGDFEKCMSFDSYSLVPVFDGEAFILL
jgi:phosphosulfolactate phosphohydrolase-like enzyme